MTPRKLKATKIVLKRKHIHIAIHIIKKHNPPFKNDILNILKLTQVSQYIYFIVNIRYPHLKVSKGVVKNYIYDK